MMQVETKADSTVVRPQGRITAANAEQLKKALQEVIEAGATRLTIDLEKVDMIDSKGLAVFIVCYQTLAQRSGTLTVVTHSPDMLGLFQVMRLDRHFTVASAQGAAAT